MVNATLSERALAAFKEHEAAELAVQIAEDRELWPDRMSILANLVQVVLGSKDDDCQYSAFTVEQREPRVVIDGLTFGLYEGSLVLIRTCPVCDEEQLSYRFATLHDLGDIIANERFMNHSLCKRGVK
jgi:hypothetical protein